MITAEQLTKIAPTIKGTWAESIATSLDKICQLPIYGINTPDIFHEFLANLLAECDEFHEFEENLHYSSEALMSLFGRHRISENDARKYGRIGNQKSNPQAIANILYGGAFGKNKLGNEQYNDGWDFRGSGPIQLTCRSNIMAFTIFYSQNFGNTFTVQQMANFLRTNLDLGIHSACWLFAISKNLIPLALNDNMTEIVKRINGGYIGLDKRISYYNRAKEIIK